MISEDAFSLKWLYEKNLKNFLSSKKVRETTWMVPMVLCCLSAAYAVTVLWEDTWSFGAVWGFLQLRHNPTTEGPRQQGHCSGCCLGERHIPHRQHGGLQSCQDLPVHWVLSCSGLTSDMTSAQVIWYQQTLTQAFASPFTSDKGFHPSSINCVSVNST